MSLCIGTLNVNGIAVVGVEKRKLISCVYKKHNVLGGGGGGGGIKKISRKK